MSDDLKKKIPQDASKVNVNEPYEVTYWCKKFDCTKDELKAAVKEVGTNADAVKKQLNKK